ncbi:CheR family methyltransferase [Actinoplanes derwentensis]|uniref:CheR family methyltransferase n=1 Tax=Actinoplanes derwentensis TaxID=113562 RepID=UPI001E4A2047|nr:CheR family methyltransferase [Actinoplanes derwentensis]
MLGIDRFKERVEIYATDVDEEQLDEARQASYGEREVQALAPDLRGCRRARRPVLQPVRRPVRRPAVRRPVRRTPGRSP